MEEEVHVASWRCYKSNKCRRPECRAANTARQREWRKKYMKAPAWYIPHGINGYDNYGCRCELCKKAKSDYYQNYVKEKKWEGGCPPETQEGKRAV